jgi:hypothetical protein
VEFKPSTPEPTTDAYLVSAQRAMKVTNSSDGLQYRASFLFQRKWIAIEEQSLYAAFDPGYADSFTLENRRIDVEIAVWTGSVFKLLLGPKLLMYFQPTIPPRLTVPNIRSLVGQLLAETDLGELLEGDTSQIKRLCAPHDIAVLFGRKRNFLTRRYVPAIFLFEWPRDQAHPPSEDRQ